MNDVQITPADRKAAEAWALDAESREQLACDFAAHAARAVANVAQGVRKRADLLQTQVLDNESVYVKRDCVEAVQAVLRSVADQLEKGAG